MMSEDGSADDGAVDENELKAFLEGKPRAWTGDKNIVKRKLQYPREDYAGHEVLRIILNALKNNDDPQLDHGALVVLEFACGKLQDSKLNPSELGSVIRGKWEELIDHKKAEFKDAVEDATGTKVKQTVDIYAWESLSLTASSKAITSFDFFLELSGGCWRLDDIVKVE